MILLCGVAKEDKAEWEKHGGREKNKKPPSGVKERFQQAVRVSAESGVKLA